MKNQCDGCCSGAPLRDGLHYDPMTGRVLMACQAHKYLPVEEHSPVVQGLYCVLVVVFSTTCLVGGVVVVLGLLGG